MSIETGEGKNGGLRESGDFEEMLRAVTEREYGDVSGRVVQEILRGRRRRRAAWCSAAAAACVCAAAVLLSGGHGDDARIPGGDSPGAGRMLVSVQGADGFWSPAESGGSEEFRTAMTGLAMLALMRGGRASDGGTPEFSESVMRAADYFCAQQRADGSFASDGDMLNHAVATVAMLELYASGMRPDLFTKLDAALDYIRRNESPSGTWPGSTQSGSASVWLAGALGLSVELGWKDAGGHFRRALRALEMSPGMDALSGVSGIAEKTAVLRGMCSVGNLPITGAGRNAGGGVYGLIASMNGY